VLKWPKPDSSKICVSPVGPPPRAFPRPGRPGPARQSSAVSLSASLPVSPGPWARAGLGQHSGSLGPELAEAIRRSFVTARRGGDQSQRLGGCLPAAGPDVSVTVEWADSEFPAGGPSVHRSWSRLRRGHGYGPGPLAALRLRRARRPKARGPPMHGHGRQVAVAGRAQARSAGGGFNVPRPAGRRSGSEPPAWQASLSCRLRLH
jgi:hypothetical protein